MPLYNHLQEDAPRNPNLEEAFISVLLRSDLEDDVEDCEARRGSKVQVTGSWLAGCGTKGCQNKLCLYFLVLSMGFLRCFMGVYDPPELNDSPVKCPRIGTFDIPPGPIGQGLNR